MQGHALAASKPSIWKEHSLEGHLPLDYDVEFNIDICHSSALYQLCAKKIPKVMNIKHVVEWLRSCKVDFSCSQEHPGALNQSQQLHEPLIDEVSNARHSNRTLCSS